MRSAVSDTTSQHSGVEAVWAKAVDRVVPSGFHGGMLRIAGLVSILGLVLFLVSASWLALEERAAPAHRDAWLEDGTPLTIHLPGRGASFSLPPERDARPPVLVLMHGFASDRAALSRLSWRLAQAGIAVVSFDAPGHGANRNPLRRGRGRPDAFAEVFGRVVDFARAYPFVDGLRIAVGGHSMGASAALDYATRDAGLDATILISGGRSHTGLYTPANPLFLAGEFEPGRIAKRLGNTATRLAAGRSLTPGETLGDHSNRAALRAQVILGATHTGIVNHPETAREIILWLRASFGGLPDAPLLLSDPRDLPWALCALSLLLCLPGLGLLAARLAPRRAEPANRGLLALPIFALGLVAALPVVANGTPLSFLSLQVGDVIASHFAFSGLALLVVLAATGRFDLVLSSGDLGRAARATGVAVFGLFALLQPIGVGLHRVALTPERALLLPLVALSLLPLSLSFQLFLRRGRPLTAAIRCLAGRALVVGVLVLGVSLGLQSSGVSLMLGALVAAFLMVELVAAPLYQRTHDPLSVAFLDASTLALLIVIVMPVSG
jgi:dienelactone hydrolase